MSSSTTDANSYMVNLTTDLSQAPFFAPFDPYKRYHRLLFKPSLSLQSRELIELQTILQDQIDRLSSHLFSEGSSVKGGEFNLDLKYAYVRIKDHSSLGDGVNVDNFVGMKVTGSTSGATAEVVNAVEGSEAGFPDTKTLFVKYTAGANGAAAVFLPNEQLTSNNSFICTVNTSANSVGLGSAFSLGEGVFYAKDSHILVNGQTVILDKYSNRPSKRVGLQIAEDIVTVADDPTLADPAYGHTNYAAPGADRLRLTCTLAALDLDADPSPDFVEIMRLKDGIVQSKADRPQYADILDELARRTDETNGDFIVNGFRARIKDHLDDGTNNGYLTLVNGGRADSLAIGIEPGTAFVKGYEYDLLVTKWLRTDKGIDFEQAQQSNITANYGAYILVNELSGVWDVMAGTQISLYNAAQTRVTARTFSSGSPSGTAIGTAKVKAIEYVSGAPGTAAATYKLYLYDINIASSYSFSGARAVYWAGAGSESKGYADIVLGGGDAVLNEPAFSVAIFPTSHKAIRNLRSDNGTIDNNFTFVKSFDVSINGSGSFSVTTGSVDEQWPYGTGPLNSSQKLSDLVLIFNQDQTAALSGTVNWSNGANTISGTSTNFNSSLAVGDLVVVGSDVSRVVSIASPTSMVVTPAASTGHSGIAIARQYKAGQHINLTGNGATGATRSVNVDSSTSITCNLQETLGGTTLATVIASVSKINGREIRKVKQTNRVVKLRLGTHSAGVAGPWSLGMADVIRLNSVRVHTADFTTGNEGSDITSRFDLDNGQRDNIYSLGSLRKVSGPALANTNYLLVNFDCFTHDASQGVGYLSIDSYPIDDVHGAANTSAIMTKEIPQYKSALAGQTFDLRDCIDARPIAAATATSTTSAAGATTNPSATVTVATRTGGLHTLKPNREFITDLSFYLPRRDLITLDRNNNYQITRGVSALQPTLPHAPTDSMLIAAVNITPYPSLPPSDAAALSRPDYAVSSSQMTYRRYTMRDIGVLDQRISSLEYYQSLSLLERDTASMKVLDSSGLDRFKNGILVDQFQGHKVGNVYSADYKCSVDPKKQELRPAFELNNVPMLYSNSSDGVVNNNNLITVPFTEVAYAQQPYASTTRNCAGLMWNWVGTMNLTPTVDNWMDTTTLPDLVVNFDNQLDNWQAIADAFGSEWGDWTTTWTGEPVITDQWTVVGQDGVYIYGNFNRSSTQTRSRSGLQATAGPAQKTDLGNRLVNASIQPFMRARAVQFSVAGLIPNTRHYAFFDGVDVNSRVVQTGNSANNHVLISAADGSLTGTFTIPENAFTVGQKVFRITDNLNNSSELGQVNSYAEAKYSAQGMQTTVQDTVISTQPVQLGPSTQTQTREINTTTVDRVATLYMYPNPEPIAESLLIDANIPAAGIFLTSIDVFFETKHATLPITLELRTMDSSSSITSQVIPYSRVTKYPADISVSTDGSAATKFTFPAPVFVKSGSFIAMILRPAGSNPDYRVFSSILGQVDILTGARIVQNPYVGTMFVSANDLSYSPAQDEDIKFVAYRASFDVGATGHLLLNNAGSNFMTVTPGVGSISVTDTVEGEARLTISSPTGLAPSVGHKVTGDTSGKVGTITGISGSVLRVKGLAYGARYTNSEHLTFAYANSSPTGGGATLGTSQVPSGFVEYYKSGAASDDIHLTTLANGTMVAGEQLTSSHAATATISAIYDRQLNVVQPQATQLVFADTTIDWGVKATSNNSVLSSTWTSAGINQDLAFSEEMAILSRSNEVSLLAGAASLQFQASLWTNNDMVSPVIDLNTVGAITVANLINNDATGETGSKGGNAMARYLTRTVTLQDGQDAEDCNVYISGYRPPSTDIKVYFKGINREDADAFDNRPWLELTALSTNAAYSSLSNSNDFIEYGYRIPDANLIGPYGEFKYTNSAGADFAGYKSYAIKVVFLSPNTSLVPRAKELRVIALQK